MMLAAHSRRASAFLFSALRQLLRGAGSRWQISYPALKQ